MSKIGEGTLSINLFAYKMRLRKGGYTHTSQPTAPNTREDTEQPDARTGLAEMQSGTVTFKNSLAVLKDKYRLSILLAIPVPDIYSRQIKHITETLVHNIISGWLYL